MTVCGLSLHQGNTKSRKKLEQKFIFQIGTLNPHGINERFSFNQLFLFINFFAMFLATSSVAPPFYIYTKCNPQFFNLLRRRAYALETSAFILSTVANLTYQIQMFVFHHYFVFVSPQFL